MLIVHVSSEAVVRASTFQQICPQFITLVRYIMLFDFVGSLLCLKSFLCPLVFYFPKKISHCGSDF